MRVKICTLVMTKVPECRCIVMDSIHVKICTHVILYKCRVTKVTAAMKTLQSLTETGLIMIHEDEDWLSLVWARPDKYSVQSK
jgi:hypothetical protein